MKEQDFITTCRQFVARMREVLDQGVDEATLERAFRHAKETAIRLGELTDKEADLVMQILKRDWLELSGIADNVEASLRLWMQRDLILLEDRLLEKLSLAADQCQIDNLKLSYWLKQLNASSQ